MKFRKKPVVIEAWQFDAPAYSPQPQWLGAAMIKGDVTYYPTDMKDAAHYTIKTLEGKMRASSGDWIIRGVKGEIYPCKPDIFVATYEPAEDQNGIAQSG